MYPIYLCRTYSASLSITVLLLFLLLLLYRLYLLIVLFLCLILPVLFSFLIFISPSSSHHKPISRLSKRGEPNSIRYWTVHMYHCVVRIFQVLGQYSYFVRPPVHPSLLLLHYSFLLFVFCVLSSNFTSNIPQFRTATQRVQTDGEKIFAQTVILTKDALPQTPCISSVRARVCMCVCMCMYLPPYGCRNIFGDCHRLLQTHVL